MTFLAAIIVGTGLLLLPGMATDEVGPLEAFFTSTSAVCVTGLVVVDTGTAFTTTGQVVIAGLIQLGGLGIMTLSVLALMLTGKRIAIDHEVALRETFTSVGRWRLGRLFFTIMAVTVGFELAGFLVLRANMDDWPAAFHSISAFCNAGFSLNADSLQGEGPAVVVPILFLLVFGGLGFTTILEIGSRMWPRRRRRPFSLHARLVFVTSIILWGGGTILLTISEGGDLETALFMSASTRTAGFDTHAVSEMAGASLFIMIPLMFIGASPGSTGGGIKTTTLALAVLVARSFLRGQERISAYGREIPYRLVRRMFTVIFFSSLVVFLTIFLLHYLEGSRADSVLEYGFEAVSAFGTVGLSTGITPELSAPSKVLLCVVMFIGRVGSLSLFLVFMRDSPASRIRYPEEQVLIG